MHGCFEYRQQADKINARFKEALEGGNLTEVRQIIIDLETLSPSVVRATGQRCGSLI